MPIRGRGQWPRTPVDEHVHDGVIQRFVALRKPHHERALALLKDVGHAVKTMMRMHGWTLGVLAEMYPRNASLLGLNYNRGEKICLRLRESSDDRVFLARDDIIATYVRITYAGCCMSLRTMCGARTTTCSTKHYGS